MNYTTLLLLLLAATLEASGDALVRHGLSAASAPRRGMFFAAGGLVLFLYGWAVNAPAWDFGRLIGVYIVFFFLIAQAIAWAIFGTPPSGRLLLGGGFILLGGGIIAMT